MDDASAKVQRDRINGQHDTAAFDVSLRPHRHAGTLRKTWRELAFTNSRAIDRGLDRVNQADQTPANGFPKSPEKPKLS